MSRQNSEPMAVWRRACVALAALPLALIGCERAAVPSDGKGTGHAGGHGAAAAPEPVTAADDDAMAGPRVTAARAETVEVVNRYCPLLVGQSVGAGKRCERSMTRTLGGRVVGFCDAECLKAWDQMSEARRGELLEEALALEATRPAGPGAGSGGMGG